MASLFIHYFCGNWKILCNSLKTARNLLRRVSTIQNCQLFTIAQIITIANMKLYFEQGLHSTVAYKTSIEKIELFHKYLYMFMVNTEVCCIFTPMLYSYIRYYHYNMGEESFLLFIPAWCVAFSWIQHSQWKFKYFILLSVLLRFPFPWKHPFGFMIATLSQWIGCVLIGNLL